MKDASNNTTNYIYITMNPNRKRKHGKQLSFSLMKAEQETYPLVWASRPKALVS